MQKNHEEQNITILYKDRVVLPACFFMPVTVQRGRARGAYTLWTFPDSLGRFRRIDGDMFADRAMRSFMCRCV